MDSGARPIKPTVYLIMTGALALLLSHRTMWAFGLLVGAARVGDGAGPVEDVLERLIAAGTDALELGDPVRDQVLLHGMVCIIHR